jgi:hypothetical protein
MMRVEHELSRRRWVRQSLAAFGVLASVTPGASSGETGGTAGTESGDGCRHDGESAPDTGPAEWLDEDDCSDLSQTAFGTDRERLAVDRSDEAAFERFDGGTDDARIARTDTEDADLVYKVPSGAATVVVEFHRHSEYGGRLLIDGKPASQRYIIGTIEEYGEAAGDWIHERHVLENRGPRFALTITGGSEEGASQIGHVEARYPNPDEVTCASAPEPLHTTVLSESRVQVSWESSGVYSGVYVDGTKVDERSSTGSRAITSLRGLSPGTHEIGGSEFSTTHDESASVTSTVEVPHEPVSRFVDDCSDLGALSPQSNHENLLVDRSNATAFDRPDGRNDADRIARANSYSTGSVVYATPNPIASVTAEVHEHDDGGGGIELYSSTDDGNSWSRVEGRLEPYGDSGGDWTHSQVRATDLPAGTTHVQFLLTGPAEGAVSGQLGHVTIDYDR